MKKENLLLGIIGLLAGLIAGYIGTNHLNQATGRGAETKTATAGSRPSSGLPANHPPAGSAEGADGQPQGDVAEAIQAARSQPENYAAQMKAGGLFREIRRFEEALEFYQQAVKVSPRQPEAQIRLADTLFDLQRYAEAESAYRSALQLEPGNVTARMDLGLTYFLREPRDLDRAISEFREALRVDSRHEKTLQNLTAALIEKGDMAAARRTLETLTEVNPGNSGIEALRGRLSGTDQTRTAR